jgi:hypothetical protein
MIGEAIYIRIKNKNPIATKRGNVTTQSWSGKSAVFLMESDLTSHGSSKSKRSNPKKKSISSIFVGLDES